MDPLQGIGGSKWQNAREHLVKGHAQRVEIASGIDRPIHPARLFRRHVGQRSGDLLGRLGDLMLAVQAGCDAEAGEPDAAARHVHQDIGRLDVFVDQPPSVHLADGSRERDGDSQERRDLHRPAEQPIKRLAAGILEHQRHATIARSESHRPRGPVSVERISEGVFVFEPLEGLTRGVFPDQQNRVEAVAGATVEGKLAFPQLREHVIGEFHHEGLASRSKHGGWKFQGQGQRKNRPGQVFSHA